MKKRGNLKLEVDGVRCSWMYENIFIIIIIVIGIIILLIFMNNKVHIMIFIVYYAMAIYIFIYLYTHINIDKRVKFERLRVPDNNMFEEFRRRMQNVYKSDYGFEKKNILNRNYLHGKPNVLGIKEK